MDGHSLVVVSHPFIQFAGEWYKLAFCGASRVLSLENSMCGWSTADMLWHGHVFVLCPPLAYYYHRVSSWGGLRRRIWRAHFTLTRHSVDLIHICLTFHEFDAMQTWSLSFTFTPMECSVCQCCCCWIIRGIVMVCHDLANNNRVVLLMNLKLQSIIDPRLT